MQDKSGVPDAVVIGRDDGHPVHVQAGIHSGRRHLDLRPWRRSTSGFAPSGTGMVLESDDIDALDHGIAELLDVSQGGSQVARVVFDDDQGRRLRAEIEPFGTRLVARLGFWQRARDTWRPADDGLLLSADRLSRLRDVLQGFRGWVQDADAQDMLPDPASAEREILRRWPTAGADWLTVEGDHVAFHPRGLRITFTVMHAEGKYYVEIQQWRRAESLWLPQPSTISLDASDVDRLLRVLARTTDRLVEDATLSPETVVCFNGSALSVSISSDLELVLEQRTTADGTEAEPDVSRICVPTRDEPRFGRALAQVWSMLAVTLSEAERTDLERRDAMATTSSKGKDEVEAPAVLEITPVASLTTPTIDEAAPPDADQEPATTPVQEPTEEAADTAEQQDLQIEPPIYIRIRSVTLGHQTITLSIQGTSDDPDLVFSWSDRSMGIPFDRLDDLLIGLRSLYYEALRGRRGRSICVGEGGVCASIDNHGPNLVCTLQQEADDHRVTLHFPANEVPHFLDAAEAALALR